MRTRLRYTLIVALCILASISFAQLNKCNSDLIAETAKSENFIRNYNVLVKGDIRKLKAEQKKYGVTVKYNYGNIASISGQLVNLLYLCNTSLVERMELPLKRQLRPLNDTMRMRNKVNQVHNGLAPLNNAYTGKGILFGFIDSGIDFNHPDFKDSTGKSRILHIWDQTFPVAGNTPMPFGYGQEWDSSYFNNGTCPHTDVAWWGHGTHTAGIGAGNGGPKNAHKGVAPDSKIIMVALDFYSSNPAISDAIQYIFKKADSLGMPCVINASVGDYYGSHDGKDLETVLIDSMLMKPGRILVGAVGNAGSIKYHVGYNVTADTNFTWLSNSGAQLAFQVYANSIDFTNVKYSIGANDNSNYSFRGNIGYKDFNYAIGTLKLDTIYNNGNRIGVVQTVADTANGIYKLNVVVFKDSTNYLWSFDATGSGNFHAWNFDFISSGLPTAAVYPRMNYYKMPDTLMTMVSGFQCSDNVITVGNYTNMDNWFGVDSVMVYWGNQEGAIAPSSSQGPTRDGRVKPDICATGDQIFAAGVLSLIPGYFTSDPGGLSLDSLHVMGGGSSSSSPVVAGSAALFLEMDTVATGIVFKQVVTGCAQLDNFTGTTGIPNPVWGYGKLDAFYLMYCVPVTVGMQEESINEMLVYPNPSTGEINFQLNKEDAAAKISIYDFQGRLIESRFTSGGKCTIDLEKHCAGVYFYKAETAEGKLSAGKLIRQ